MALNGVAGLKALAGCGCHSDDGGEEGLSENGITGGNGGEEGMEGDISDDVATDNETEDKGAIASENGTEANMMTSNETGAM